MMMMYFHGGYKEVILFKFWETKEVSTFVLSCFALFVIAILYEALKLLRDKLLKDEIIRKQRNVLQSNRTITHCHCSPNNNTNNSNNNNKLNGTTSSHGTSDNCVVEDGVAFLGNKTSGHVVNTHNIDINSEDIQVDQVIYTSSYK
jgi:hypothetical protein